MNLKLCLKITKIIFIINCFIFSLINKTNSAFLSNGFVVTSGLYNFDTKTNCNFKNKKESCICNIKIFYPKINFVNKEIGQKVNHIIYDFAHSFKSCAKTDLNYGKKIINYQFPDSGYKDFFSIKFFKKEGDIIQKQYSFTFNKNTGELVDFFEIFDNTNDLRKFILDNFGDFLGVKEGFVSSIKNNISLNKLQFYIETGLFHLVLNKKVSEKNTTILDIVVPKNFIKANYARS